MKFLSDPRFIAGASAVGFAASRGGSAIEWFKRRVTARVVVYDEVMTAVFRAIGDKMGPFIEMRPDYGHGPAVPASRSDSPASPADHRRSSRNPGPGSRLVKINGKRVSATYTVEEKGFSRYQYVTLTCHVKHFDWLTEWVEGVYREFQESQLQRLTMYAPAAESWMEAGQRPFRPIESIQHPEYAPQVALKLIQDWHEHERATAAHGENFHIGILLTGPPGTGKTSTAIALASELRRNLYVVDPKTIKDAGPYMMSQVKGGLLLVEECDEIFPARGNGKDDKTTSALLSAFDGPFSPWDVVRIYTTNHPDRLDPSFLRAGRVDHSFEFPERAHP